MEQLNKIYDKMQNKYGSKNLQSVYGNGSLNPDIVLCFMNPTSRNIATNKNWNGIKAQWLGTKQIWNFLTECKLFNEDLNNEIQSMKREEWTEDFCQRVYDEVSNKKLWITNLAKCSQQDAKPLPDSIFKEYRDLLIKEIEILKPKKIILFGNQVSSILLKEKISVSLRLTKTYKLNINNQSIDTYCLYYPVGNGFFNKDKTVYDLKSIVFEGE